MTDDNPHAAADPAARRRARCSCGAVSLDLAGAPESTYLCACAACRRATGSAFGWRVRYTKAAARIDGTPRTYRRHGDSGRWVEQAFCATCGTTVFMTAEAMPDHLVVSAGCFDTVDDLAPARLFHGEGLGAWCALALHEPAG